MHFVMGNLHKKNQQFVFVRVASLLKMKPPYYTYFIWQLSLTYRNADKFNLMIFSILLTLTPPTTLLYSLLCIGAEIHILKFSL